MDTRTGRIYDTKEIQVIEKYLGEHRTAEDIVEFNKLFKDIKEEERPRRMDDLKVMKRNLTTYQRETRKVGRNEPCPCGSDKKFKRCCLQNGKQ